MLSIAHLSLIGASLIVFLLLSLTGCVTDLHGPKVDLSEIAMPAPVAAPVAGPALPASMQSPPSDLMRVWVVPRTEANGDTAQGYFRFLSLTAPPAEMTEPASPMPRVPAPGGRVHAASKGATSPPGPGTGAPVVPPPPGLSPTPGIAPASGLSLGPGGMIPGTAGPMPPQQLMDSLFPKGR